MKYLNFKKPNTILLQFERVGEEGGRGVGLQGGIRLAETGARR